MPVRGTCTSNLISCGLTWNVRVRVRVRVRAKVRG